MLRSPKLDGLGRGDGGQQPGSSTTTALTAQLCPPGLRGSYLGLICKMCAAIDLWRQLVPVKYVSHQFGLSYSNSPHLSSQIDLSVTDLVVSDLKTTRPGQQKPRSNFLSCPLAGHRVLLPEISQGFPS
ncbi:hypothetical protein Tco_0680519 [Tanacetum coccineum]|uniref:Uncharacterized protein n=1 Tax=Tanacetum coccineum TaxID=301880 RepID=A0ABQ4XKR0_9ASTR